MAGTNILYDVVVIGAGPAGMAAAALAGENGCSVLIIDKEGYGGQLKYAPTVEKYLCDGKISGQELANDLCAWMADCHMVSHWVGKVILIKYNHGLFMLSLEDRTVFCCRSIIVATGTAPKQSELATNNLYYSAVNLTGLLKNKKAVVLGSGNRAASNALELATYCEHVYICDKVFDLTCADVFTKQIDEAKNISFLPNCSIMAIKNTAEGNLISVTLDTLATIDASGIVVANGRHPQADFTAMFTDRDASGYIITDEDYRTGKVPGVFAAGSCLNRHDGWTTTAIGEAAHVAKEAVAFVKAQKAG